MTALLNLFYEKLTCNSSLRKPVSFDPLESEDIEGQGKFILQLPRVVIPELAESILTVTQIVYIIIYLYTFPLSLLFIEVS